MGLLSRIDEKRELTKPPDVRRARTRRCPALGCGQTTDGVLCDIHYRRVLDKVQSAALEVMARAG